jgi:ketosteroid isomerase-like protein
VSADDVQLLRDSYESLNAGDYDAALALLAGDAEWVEHSSLPEAGAYHGRDAIRRFLESFLESWDEFSQSVETLVDAGDRVAVVLRSRARGKGSGVEVQGRYAHVWTMREGSGVRVDTYEDVDTALASLEPGRSLSARNEP